MLESADICRISERSGLSSELVEKRDELMGGIEVVVREAVF